MYRWLSFTLAFGVLTLAPLAKASEWDKRTIVTFHEPVEIPGKVLPAGTYVMKLVDNKSERDIVQFFNKDESQLIDTVMGINDYRDTPTGKTVITFEERAANSPEAVKDWFYPGDLYGVEFIYPHYHPATSPNNEMHSRPQPGYEATAAPAPKAESQTQAVTKPANHSTAQTTTQPAPAPQPPQQMAMAKPEPAPAPAPEPAPAPQANSKPATKQLPKTASNLPLIGLSGMLAMIAGIALRKRNA